MKTLTLSQNKLAIVDDEDFDYLNQWKWCYRNDGYAVRRVAGTNTIIRMHRFIMKTPEGMLTDHINGNRLDNRKENLRICNDLQNAWNINSKTTNFSGIRGVYWNKLLDKWRAKIMVNRKNIHLGLYDTKEEAQKAREKAEKMYFGEFSSLSTTPVAGMMGK